MTKVQMTRHQEELQQRILEDGLACRSCNVQFRRFNSQDRGEGASVLEHLSRLEISAPGCQRRRGV